MNITQDRCEEEHNTGGRNTQGKYRANQENQINKHNQMTQKNKHKKCTLIKQHQESHNYESMTSSINYLHKINTTGLRAAAAHINTYKLYFLSTAVSIFGLMCSEFVF